MQTINRWLGMTVLCAAGMATLTGCPAPVKPEAAKPRYGTRPPDPNMPAYMKGSIKDLTVTENTGDFPVSSYGLVTGLRGTGDCTAPSLVREWMKKEMDRHAVGSPSAGYGNITSEQMLADPSVAIVRVVANVPPGARKGDTVDVMVQALPNNATSSLANGMLWRTALKINGDTDPFGAINEFVKTQGNIFVNPAYAAGAGTTSAGTTQPSNTARASLRMGLIPAGGFVTTDRPIHLVLRSPSWAASRGIESRINLRYQTPDHFKDPTALAQDEGYIHLYVPRFYQGNWQHFIGVVTHLFMNSDGAFSAMKAKQLAEEALQPDAKLLSISYCWEAIGPASIPFITPLLSNPQPDVQYAAARAAAFLGDRYGEDTLVQIASTPKHPFQVEAVQTLGELPSSSLINASVATLLDSDQSLVRIEAYKVLIKHNDQHVFSKLIHSRLNPENEFTLDLVPSNGPPLIYCSRLGRPRVAIFGRKVSMQTPVIFSAFDNRLTISTVQDKPKMLDVYYREAGRRGPVEALSSPDVGELVARLGGASDEGFHFTYGDIVAILQSMTAAKKVPAAFVLQTLPWIDREVKETPAVLDQGRPQADASQTPSQSQIGASLPEMPLPQQPKDKDSKDAKKEEKNTSGRPQ